MTCYLRLYRLISDVPITSGGGEVNRWMDGGVPFWLLSWYPKV